MLLAGFCLILQQFFVIRELTALLLGFELVITGLLVAYFSGQSLAYAIAPHWKSAWTRPLLITAFLTHLSLPFSLRLLFAVLWGHQWHVTCLLCMGLAAFLVAMPFSILLPLAAAEDGLPVARGYAAEISGAVLGVGSLALLVPHGPAVILVAYLTALLALAALVARTPRIAWLAPLLVAYCFAFAPLDRYTSNLVYATLGFPGSRLVFSTYTPFQKMDVLDVATSRMLFLNGYCYYDSTSGHDFNVMLAQVPADALHHRIHEALVFGSGSLECPRALLAVADRVTSV
ncbi:MAG: spermidine synthase family protein [Candidatus Xenobia bacterium]